MRGLIPFKNEQTIESSVAVEDEAVKEDLPVEALTIESAVANNTKTVTEETMVVESVKETNETNSSVTQEVNETTISVNQF